MATPVEDPRGVRTGLSVEELQRAFQDNLLYVQGRFAPVASRNDYYLALAYTVRDRLLHRWVNSARTYLLEASRTVCYLSAEYLPGPHLGLNLLNLGIEPQVREALAGLGLELDDLLEQEEEPGLGNGGLGRLAACYLESMATLQLPAIGYGIRYEFGIFDQEIVDGWQVEVTDKWLHLGNPWEIARPEIAVPVGLGGHTERWVDDAGRFRVRWVPERVVKGVAHDTPVLGHRVNAASLLRLWKAEAVESFEFGAFNVGDYYGAVESKVHSENLTKVLYPNDEPAAGRRLRLEQQYFLTRCALHDMVRILLQRPLDLDQVPEKYAVQLNDTHPALAVAEFMRLLVDEHLLPWERAWDLTRRTFSYTNHTLLPEALEKWSLDLLRRVLPRHAEIILEINHRFLDDVRLRWPGDDARVRELSLIEEGPVPRVRMAHLACVGSHSVNGVARLHSRLLTESVLRPFWELDPDKFFNVTNGVTPRRFLALCNPRLARLVTEQVGEGWLSDLERLRDLEPCADDAGFRDAWRDVKRRAKEDLARFVLERTGVTVDPGSLVDVQLKRIHEYKRQHLNLLHVIARYLRCKHGLDREAPARTVLFAGKAAPGYARAKLIVKLAHAIADVVNSDPAVGDRLRVVFVPDYNVKNAERLIPGADLSQQISLAGMEASGTGNMKLALNGALTLGTLDGANVEIRDAVGAENFFEFGLTVEEVARHREAGHGPREFLDRDPVLAEALHLLASGFFAHGDRELFRPLVDALLGPDRFLVCADFSSYAERQDSVDDAWNDPEAWARMSILNVARVGRFSSDRAVAEYAEAIWKVTPVPVELTWGEGEPGAASLADVALP